MKETILVLILRYWTNMFPHYFVDKKAIEAWHKARNRGRHL